MKKRQLDAIKRMNTILSFVLSLSIVFLFSLQPLKAQVPPPPPLPDSGSSAGNGVTPGEPIYGKVDGTPLSQAHPEDITNENFPDKIDSFDYPNADISDVIKAISRLTGKNFIIEQGVKGKITIVAPTQITVAEAYRAFLSALASLNYTVVPAGKFLKIKNSRAAQRDSIETYAGEYFPNTDQMITRIIKLKYISATEVDKQLRTLPTKDGEMRPYEPTNSLIVTDYGSNIERIMKIIKELDVPGFEEQLAVIQIYHAKAKNISDLIDQIINKDNKKNNSRFSSSRFNRNNNNDPGGSESYSLVTADERTNSIIVVGNEIGVKKIRGLVKKLDFKLRLEDSGGVYVYPVRFGDAEEMAKTLGGIAKQDATTKTKTPTTNNRQEAAPAPPKPIFGGDVNITADKQTNSLIITASRQDYLVVKNLLSKIDVSRDQVFVKVIIMEMNAENGTAWGVDYYNFDKDSKGLGRIGFRTTDNLGSLLNPTSEQGVILGFGGGDTFTMSSSAGGQEVSTLAGFIKFIKTNVGANILSTPQIMALDNEEAEIEVGENVPVGTTSTATNGTASQGIDRQDATIKLNIKPFISPDSDTVKLVIDQKIAQVSNKKVIASELNNTAISLLKRALKTTIVVNDGDTAVLGGLMSDSVQETIKKVPVLGDLPILGWLFKSKKVDKIKQNLLLFITPKIIRSQEQSSDLLTQKIDERIDFLKDYMHGKDPHGKEMDNLPRYGKTSAAPVSASPSTSDDHLIDSTGSDEMDEQPQEEPAIESF